MKKTIGYIRVSSESQAIDRTSLERQEKQIRDYCSSRNLTDLTILADEGISGYKSTARQGYMELCSLCLKKKVSTVIVYDLSRISRNTEETLHFINSICEKNKIKFISLKDDIDSSTASGKFMLTVLAGLNQQYRDVISEKTKEALKHKKANSEKTGGTVPFGYTVSKAGKLTPLVSEQKAIQLMIELRTAGKSLRQIATELTSRGILTKTGKTTWSAKVVMKILENHSKENLNTKQDSKGGYSNVA